MKVRIGSKQLTSSKYARLATLKEIDPINLFRLNQNIRPMN